MYNTKNAIFLCFHLLVSQILMAQKPLAVSDTIIPVSIATDANFYDLEGLKKILAAKRIVLLGEQTHGEGSTFSAKVMLIKFLHQELDFDLLLFESGFYDNFLANEHLKKNFSDGYTLNETVFHIWADTKEFSQLISYVEQRYREKKPLQVGGFDFQEGTAFQHNFLVELVEMFKAEQILLKNTNLSIVEQVMHGDLEFLAENREDSIAFFKTCKTYIEGLDKIILQNRDVNAMVYKQALVSWVAGVNWYLEEINGIKHQVQNPRDLQMAKNLIFWAEMFPEKKIICWGANYHFANRIDKYLNTSTTKNYIAQMEQQQRESFDLDSALDGAFPMGRILKDHFKDELYSLAFTSYQGEYGIIGREIWPILKPPAASFEDVLVGQGFKNAIIDFKDDSGELFYSSALGNLPVKAPWAEIFDGMFFIKEARPPQFNDYAERKATPVVKEDQVSISIKGKVSDFGSGEGIPYASISIKNTTRGTSTNAEGYFVFNLPISFSKDSLIVSSVGYENLVLPLEAISNRADARIKLKPAISQLQEVVIQADKILSAQEIIRKARKAIDVNYYQKQFNQDLFYRVQRQKNDSVEFNEEAYVKLYDERGYEPTSAIKQKRYGEILQYRNTTDNPEKNRWGGVGSLWLIFSHDIIMDKSNVLHRLSFFDTELENISYWNGNLVYEISFSCNKPGSFTMGYASLETGVGKLIINAEDFAVLRYEVCMERKDFSDKKRQIEHKNARIYHQQTYEKSDGFYFLKHSKQWWYEEIFFQGSKIPVIITNIHDLLSTSIETREIREIQKPLINLKAGDKIREDTDFWKTHSFILEDERAPDECPT